MDSRAPLDVIAASLRRHRARAGLSLTEVAKRAGVAKSTLSQLESGTGNPSVETAGFPGPSARPSRRA